MNYINLIDEELKKQPVKDKVSHRASECSAIVDGHVVGTCNRRQWYDWKKVTASNPPNAGALLKMHIGTVLGAEFPKFLKQAGKQVETEKEFSQSFEGLKNPVTGHIDCIVDGNVGLEFKTTYGAGMTSKEGIKNTGAKMEHILQTTVYAFLSGIKEWYLLYFARDNGYRTQFPVTITIDRWQSILARWMELEKHLDDNTPPPRDFGKQNWQCDYCQYKDHCWKGE